MQTEQEEPGYDSRKEIMGDRVTEEIKKQAMELGVDKRIARSLEELGFTQFTPIQEQTIPLLLSGKDTIGQAQTGTGKTAAFGIPLLQKIDPECKDVQAIVLCPTRELAIQAAEELRKFAKYMHGIKVLPIYGGQDIGRQIKALKAVQVIVGTPGRVMDHMRRHTLKLGNLRVLVLDEADEMLNMGFREDIEQILKDVPQERQTALFSATMPKPILEITHTYQKADAEYVKVTPKELTIPLVKQYYYEVRRDMKKEVTARLLDYYGPARSLIFCNTKKMVDELAKYLKGKGYPVEGLHGDLSQMQRDRVMHGFRSGGVSILIATDVAARGIDVDDVEAVFNFDVPQDIEYYVHRIGRTGRAGRKGKSFTLVAGREIYRIRDIERFCNTKIEAKRLPSVDDVVSAKATKVLANVTKACREQELEQMKVLIKEWMDREQLSALEAAAAFLRLEMGEEIEEIPEVEHRNRRGNRAERRDGQHRGNRNSQRNGSKNDGRPRNPRDRQQKVRQEKVKPEKAKQLKTTVEAKPVQKPKDIRNDGTPVTAKRKRHDHTGQRKKLITGENKDYGYDTDSSVYHRPDIHSGHTLEIKIKEDMSLKREVTAREHTKKSVEKGNRKKSSFRFFKKK